MAVIKELQDIECWQSALDLNIEIFDLAKKLEFKKEYEIRSQLKRASISVMNNIAEGFGRFSNKEFVRYLNIGYASAIEVQSMLFLLNKLSIISPNEFKLLHSRVERTMQLIAGFVRYLKKPRNEQR